MATFTGVSTTGAVDLPLPESVTAAKLPLVSCWMSDPTFPGVWVPADQWDGSDPFCALVVLANGRVEIRLRQWFPGWSYFIVAAWPT